MLDIVDVPLLEARPGGYQRENWLLDPNGGDWERRGQAGWADLAQLADPVEPLWVDGYHTYSGLNDQIPLAQAGAAQSSLCFLHVAGVTLSVFKPGEARSATPSGGCKDASVTPEPIIACGLRTLLTKRPTWLSRMATTRSERAS